MTISAPAATGAVIDRIGLGDDQVRTLRGPTKRGRSGLHLAEPIVAQRTQHNHSVAERQLGVRDAIAPVFVDGLGAKAERIAKPTDHALGVAVGRHGITFEPVIFTLHRGCGVRRLGWAAFTMAARWLFEACRVSLVGWRAIRI